MKTFRICSKVIRIGFDHWSVKKRRMKLLYILERFESLDKVCTTDVLYEEILGI